MGEFQQRIADLQTDGFSKRDIVQAAAEIGAEADARIAELEREVAALNRSCDDWEQELRIHRETDGAKVAELERECAELREHLEFVERWSVHHALKRRPSGELVYGAAEILSTIRSYPPIREITERHEAAIDAAARQRGRRREMANQQDPRDKFADVLKCFSERQEQLRKEELEQKRIDAAAGMMAERLLAERDMPEDLLTFARTVNLEHWALAVCVSVSYSTLKLEHKP